MPRKLKLASEEKLWPLMLFLVGDNFHEVCVCVLVCSLSRADACPLKLASSTISRSGTHIRLPRASLPTTSAADSRP